MNAFKFFELSTAINLHFKEGSKYNFHKYRGKVNCSNDSFIGRKDKYFFEKISKKLVNDDEAIFFLASNNLHGNTYVRNYSYELYLDYGLAYKDALFYKFAEDITKYKKHDLIELCFIGDTQALRYLIILDELSNGKVIKRYIEKYKDNPIVWNNFYERKFLTFREFVLQYVNIDDENIRNGLINLIKQNTK